MKNAIRISCNRSNLKVVRDFVSTYLAAYSLSDLHLNQIVLAVDEVVANLIIHANSEDDTQHLDLRLNVDNQVFGIEIEDDSKSSYTPSSYREPDLHEHIRTGKKGGVGMALVNRIMDRVEFSTTGAHNVCRLYKKIA
ncbi:serine/threonine-protein kinase RsbW [Hymenobacter daecheongensis DSM 21074]|uniref:Serine/threonine-protein kinase RsbW n=1 Tax=Hymenobacter daecheongensis DSM 21074 TaxID=1121955 RepID=A0A1M6D1Z6_9BACT|nr:ATP-binding protein [Hymenobacter daecheongensis]SHI67141.1 serine/threonine-protein kinase RsbW [Hymenobacter daecheongensis DSM 21074]